MENKPRKPWLAGLLSLIQPGLGQLYNGEIRKALIFYSLPLLLVPAGIICIHTEFIRVFMATYLLLALTYYFYAVSDSIKTAKKYKNQYEPKKFNKAYVYIGAYLLVAIVSTSLSAVMKSNFVQAFKISSAAMEPTLLLGDHVLTDRSKSARKPNRGDLIAFEYPEDPTKDFIKRVVAVGGDTVEIRNKELLVNGKAVSEPYIVHNEADVVPAKENHRDNYGPTTIPEGEYFGMGDNRDRSYDSRFWGTIPQNKIKGSVKSIYWSWDKEKFAVRWNRVGVKVQ